MTPSGRERVVARNERAVWQQDGGPARESYRGSFHDQNACLHGLGLCQPCVVIARILLGKAAWQSSRLPLAKRHSTPIHHYVLVSRPSWDRAPFAFHPHHHFSVSSVLPSLFVSFGLDFVPYRENPNKKAPFARIGTKDALCACAVPPNVDEHMPPEKTGGPEGARTPDLLHAMQTRSQLRHRPKNADCSSTLRRGNGRLAGPS